MTSNRTIGVQWLEGKFRHDLHSPNLPNHIFSTLKKCSLARNKNTNKKSKMIAAVRARHSKDEGDETRNQFGKTDAASSSTSSGSSLSGPGLGDSTVNQNSSMSTIEATEIASPSDPSSKPDQGKESSSEEPPSPLIRVWFPTSPSVSPTNQCALGDRVQWGIGSLDFDEKLEVGLPPPTRNSSAIGGRVQWGARIFNSHTAFEEPTLNSTSMAAGELNATQTPVSETPASALAEYPESLGSDNRLHYLPKCSSSISGRSQWGAGNEIGGENLVTEEAEIPLPASPLIEPPLSPVASTSHVDHSRARKSSPTQNSTTFAPKDERIKAASLQPRILQRQPPKIERSKELPVYQVPIPEKIEPTPEHTEPTLSSIFMIEVPPELPQHLETGEQPVWEVPALEKTAPVPETTQPTLSSIRSISISPELPQDLQTGVWDSMLAQTDLPDAWYLCFGWQYSVSKRQQLASGMSVEVVTDSKGRCCLAGVASVVRSDSLIGIATAFGGVADIQKSKGAGKAATLVGLV